MTSSLTVTTDAQPAPTPPETWQLRLLGGAIGALCSGMAGVALFLWTGYLGLIGLVGVPAGTVVGLVAAPTVVRTRRRVSLLLALAVTATLTGAVMLSIWGVAAASRNANLGDLVAYVVPTTLFVVYLSFWFGGPLALVVAFLATMSLRKLAGRARRLWLPAALIVALVSLGSGVVVVQARANASDDAARLGDRVSFDYVLDNQSTADYWFSYGSSYGDAPIDTGLLNGDSIGAGGCSSGSNSVQGSLWMTWLARDPDGMGVAPSGSPLVSSSSYGAHAPITLRITIRPDGTFVVDRDRDDLGSC